jgi:hypothetical protein
MQYSALALRSRAMHYVQQISDTDAVIITLVSTAVLQHAAIAESVNRGARFGTRAVSTFTRAAAIVDELALSHKA